MDAEDDAKHGESVAVSKGPCEFCGGTKCRTVYTDGHSFCFRCPEADAFKPGDGTAGRHLAVVAGVERDYGDLLDPAKQHEPYAPLKKRGITADTMRKLGLFHGGYSGGQALIGNMYNQDGELAAQKVRLPTSKDFPTIKGPGYTDLLSLKLFGQQHFGDRFDRQVIITEGFEDAASVAQETDFKVAVVSVTAGAANAAKNLKANYLWLDRFEEIILWFDNDEPGQLAVKECAPLFRVGKVRVAKAFGFKDGLSKVPCKDASDMLQANRPGDIKAAVYAAVAWRPPGVVNAKANPQDTFANRDGARSYDYPECMAVLQEMTGGMYDGDVVYHAAGTGVGKSTQTREIAMALVEQGVKVAYFSFEDTKRDAKFGLMSIKAGQRLGMVPEPKMPKEVIRGIREATPKETAEFLKECDAYDALMGKWHEVTFGGGMVELFDPETAEWTMKAILAYVYYVVRALGCWAVIIDPLSFLAAGLDLNADERRVLDGIAAELAKAAKELGCHLQICHHLKRVGNGVPHEEGAPTSLNELRSSGGLANFATAVVGWERNNQAEGDAWRVTRSRVIKTIRRTGRSGLADTLYYGEDGRLAKSHIPFPPIGKPEGAEGGDKPGGGSFSPVGDGDY
jgi:twinkle protein